MRSKKKKRGQGQLSGFPGYSRDHVQKFAREMGGYVNFEKGPSGEPKWLIYDLAGGKCVGTYYPTAGKLYYDDRPTPRNVARWAKAIALSTGRDRT